MISGHFRQSDIRPVPFSVATIHQALVDKLAALSGLATLLLHELVHLRPLVI